MSLRIESWNFKIPDEYPNDILLNEIGDENFYRKYGGSAGLPTHTLHIPVKNGGIGGTPTLHFGSADEANRGLKILEQIKSTRKLNTNVVGLDK